MLTFKSSGFDEIILQTVYPILGEKGMMEAVAFYNSEEGKDVLRRHGQFDAAARFKEGSETVLGTDIMEFVSTMNTKIYSKTNENFNPSSESRNQNFAFVLLHAKGSAVVVIALPGTFLFPFGYFIGQIFAIPVSHRFHNAFDQRTGRTVTIR